MNVAHTELGSTATGTAVHVPGKPLEKSQSESGNGVSPTLPEGSALHSPAGLGAVQPTEEPGAGLVVDETGQGLRGAEAAPVAATARDFG